MYLIYTFILSTCTWLTTSVTSIQRKEALIGQRVNLDCGLVDSGSEFHWQHTGVGNPLPSSVFRVGKFFINYANRSSIEEINGHHVLTIRDLQRQDAGTYVCERIDEHGIKKTPIQLIIFESPPTCQAHSAQLDLVGENACGILPDVVSLTCSIQYFGNVQPVLEWLNVSENGTTQSNGYQISHAVDTKLKFGRNLYTCTTSSRGHSCHVLLAAKPSYVINTTRVMVLKWPQNVSCSANSSVPCSYEWLNNGEVISTSPTLEFTTTSSPGHYRCQADCMLRNNSCTVTPLLVTFEYSAGVKFELGNILIPLVAAMVIATIIASVCIHICVRYRRDQRGSHGSTDKQCLSRNLSWPRNLQSMPVQFNQNDQD